MTGSFCIPTDIGKYASRPQVKVASVRGACILGRLPGLLLASPGSPYILLPLLSQGGPVTSMTGYTMELRAGGGGRGKAGSWSPRLAGLVVGVGVGAVDARPLHANLHIRRAS